MNTPINPGNTGIGTTSPQHLLHISQPPPWRSKLWITPEFACDFTHDAPNRWRRFWYWALLGWRWSKP
jgi:hypothetical protein